MVFGNVIQGYKFYIVVIVCIFIVWIFKVYEKFYGGFIVFVMGLFLGWIWCFSERYWYYFFVCLRLF